MRKGKINKLVKGLKNTYSVKFLLLLVLILLAAIFGFLLINRTGYNPEIKTPNKFPVVPTRTETPLKATSDTTLVTDPWLGFNYDCRNDKLSSITDSFGAYNQSVNTQNTCFDNKQKTHESCTARCGTDIKNICNSDTMSKSMGYADKQACYAGEDPKFQRCLNDCSYFSSEELKRCNGIVTVAKENMKTLLKQYCEISIE